MNRIIWKVFRPISRFWEISVENALRNEFSNPIRALHREATIETGKYFKSFHIPSFRDRWQLLDFSLNNAKVEGFFLEFGVKEGRSINYIAKKCPDKQIYGFDSFQGLPESWTGKHEYNKGSMQVSKIPKVEKNVILYEGLFSRTLPDFVLDSDEDVAFIHVDCDLYSSTKCVFDNLEKKITTGTITQFDEYSNYPNWKNHEFKAFQEFIDKNELEYSYIGQANNFHQISIRIK